MHGPGRTSKTSSLANRWIPASTEPAEQDRVSHEEMMRTIPTKAILVLRAATVITVAALALSACTTSQSITTSVRGTPSISVSVPLQTVACTTSNSCLAVGTSATGVGPSAVGEYQATNGKWSVVAVPPASSSQIAVASCWRTGCLLGGSQPSGDLLWRYNETSHTLVVVSPPAQGLGVSALSCAAALSCAVVDSSSNGQARLAFTSDGGSTWTTPVAVAWTTGDVVTSLACTTPSDCALSATTPGHLAQLEVTSDGGSTWRARSTPSSWTSLMSLRCVLRQCVGLTTTAAQTNLVRSSNFTRTWRSVSLAATANAVACTSMNRCVLVGQTSSQRPWVATVRRDIVTTSRLQYVPSPLLDVACGATQCAAIGVTTVLSIRP